MDSFFSDYGARSAFTSSLTQELTKQTIQSQLYMECLKLRQTHLQYPIGPDELDEFVSIVDAVNGPNSPEFAKIASKFSYLPRVKIDKKLDPFSEDYFSQMLLLYEELSGRQLEQETGEITEFDLEKHVAAANPYCSNDVTFIAKHARAVLTSMLAAKLPEKAKVLDLGCGWGLSSEMIAFTGAEVTAVDINPNFVNLVSQRSKRNAYNIDVLRSNFDAVNTDKLYDAAFFYECLHHSVKPWVTIQHIGNFLKQDGKFIIAGEPINDIWWPHWGLRLDALSVYCIRKFGWFESGWSKGFIKQCFERAGFLMNLYPDIGLDGGYIGIAVRNDQMHKGDEFDIDLNILIGSLKKTYLNRQTHKNSKSYQYVRSIINDIKRIRKRLISSSR